MSEALLSTDQTTRVPQACAGVSTTLDEPLLGTAPHAVAWLLLEHAGPWPATAPGGLLDPAIADELERRCARHRVRMVAVRRATSRADVSQQVCYVASSRPGRTWIERVPLAEPKDLLELDLDAVADGIEPGIGERLTGPLFAVCTHGKRDTCCAAQGRPVQRTLSHLAPGRVWEATHIGGHRFAANVLVLPEGLVYGRVDERNARTLFEAHGDGTIAPTMWRGRSAHPQPAQAAEWFARHATGLAAIDDITLDGLDLGRGPAPPDDDVWTVRLDAAGRPLTAVVARVRTGCQRVTACTGVVADPGRWLLRSLR